VPLFTIRVFLNEETGQAKKTGDIVKNPVFAETLKSIANEGVDIFYNGILGDKVVEDIQQRGGIITKDDLMQYRLVKLRQICIFLIFTQ
jgi:gamma-glutamyltranspeptidase